MQVCALPKAVAVAAAFVLIAASEVHADSAHVTLSVPDLSVIDIAGNGRPVAVHANGQWHQIQLVDGQVALEPVDPIPAEQQPADSLPDGRSAHSANGTRAWLSAPTDRYRHAVLGDGIEAGGLTVAHPGSPPLSMILPTSSVFEDRYPRFADMNGDGNEEILLVRAYANAGGALALIDPGTPGAPPRVVAEGPAIGTPNRWMNPAGVGDVDGDGRPEAVVVITPHIGGMLTAYEWRGDRLIVDHEMFGFSNHAIGARELALSTVADLNGDGVAEVVVPNIDRTEMMIVSFAGDEPSVIDRMVPQGGIAHRVVVYDLDQDDSPEITFATVDGTIVVWRPEL